MKSNVYSKIFVTRPLKQNIKLQQQLQIFLQQNNVALPVVSLPLIAIVPQGAEQEAKAIHQALNQTEWVSFVSPNAFWMTHQLLQKYQLLWPTHLKIAVVGGGTEASIVESGMCFVQIVKPKANQAWDSEGLWGALCEAQPQWLGVTMVMIHGDGGRNFLAEKLTLAGAKIQEFSVYRREGLAIDDPAWQEVKPRENAIWVFNSSQAAEFLQKGLEQLGIPTSFITQQLAIVSHARILETIERIGFQQTKSIEPGDENLMKELLQLVKTPL